MSWWGKVIGGTLGFMIGGPLGALLGVALGHQLDDSGPVLDWTGAAGGDNERIQTVFFTTTFSVMGHLCKADGRVSEDEIRIARAVMAHMQLNSEQEKAAERLFSQGKDDGFPLTQVIHQFRQETRRRRDLVRVFMELQVQAAMADGIITDAERDVLYTLCRELSFSAIELAHIEALVRAQQAGGPRAGGQRQAPRRASLSEAYEVLGIARDASDAEVKKAYRRLMNQHHPDKLVSRGLPEEMIQVAQEKASDISKAYEQIKEARGFK